MTTSIDPEWRKVSHWEWSSVGFTKKCVFLNGKSRFVDNALYTSHLEYRKCRFLTKTALAVLPNLAKCDCFRTRFISCFVCFDSFDCFLLFLLFSAVLTVFSVLTVLIEDYCRVRTVLTVKLACFTVKTSPNPAWKQQAPAIEGKTGNYGYLTSKTPLLRVP